jgi:hypothetical protein
MANEFCAAVPKFADLRAELLHVSLLAPQTVRWFTDLWKVSTLQRVTP